ncbi:hypothetical protein ACQ4PT_040390 [Festuca glaucescens]
MEDAGAAAQDVVGALTIEESVHEKAPPTKKRATSQHTRNTPGTMRALYMAVGRGAVACATPAAAVPRRSLLLSTAAAGAALQSEPIRLSGRGASGTAKLRASADAAQAAATSFVSKEEAFAWAKKDNRRLLHVVYRVGDIDRTIKSVASPSAAAPVHSTVLSSGGL